MKKLFTERHGHAVPRVAEQLDDTTRNGLLTLIAGRIDDEWFGLEFPSGCGDGFPYAGTDRNRLQETMKGYGVLWPDEIEGEAPPSDGEVFDLIEFSYEFIAEPRELEYHSYMGHSHYAYDRDTGREKFINDVNRVFERNGMAFALKAGEVTRLAPAVLQESLSEAVYHTGGA